MILSEKSQKFVKLIKFSKKFALWVTSLSLAYLMLSIFLLLILHPSRLSDLLNKFASQLLSMSLIPYLLLEQFEKVLKELTILDEKGDLIK